MLHRNLLNDVQPEAWHCLKKLSCDLMFNINLKSKHGWLRSVSLANDQSVCHINKSIGIRDSVWHLLAHLFVLLIEISERAQDVNLLPLPLLGHRLRFGLQQVNRVSLCL